LQYVAGRHEPETGVPHDGGSGGGVVPGSVAPPAPGSRVGRDQKQSTHRGQGSEKARPLYPPAPRRTSMLQNNGCYAQAVPNAFKRLQRQNVVGDVGTRTEMVGHRVLTSVSFVIAPLCDLLRIGSRCLPNLAYLPIAVFLQTPELVAILGLEPLPF